MEFQPINLPELIGIIMGTSIALVPVIGATMRFALKPVVEALGKVWAAKDSADRVAVLERRVAFLERQLEAGPSLAHLEPGRITAPID